jgi:hypothetical protein
MPRSVAKCPCATMQLGCWRSPKGRVHEVYPFAVTNLSQLLWLDPPSSHGWMVQGSLPRLFTQFRWEQTAYARHSKVQVLQLRPGKAAGASRVTFVADSTWLVGWFFVVEFPVVCAATASAA